MLGEPRKGVSGWRLTHQEAQAALLVAMRRPEPLVRFTDHALFALVLQNELLMRSLMGIYLPSLGNPVARETLRAYFSAGCNAATAAAKLEIDRHTVERGCGRSRPTGPPAEVVPRRARGCVPPRGVGGERR